ncbi:hypothetical protein E5676_scaffold84664G00860 [Cucumis melo var. makuwa]|uniref:Protein MNN4-like n=1 Tax=Cucumis melo var. makuwa TaxID=1194695 RepID=A0A5D3E4B8_CUCMM|nr:hypothetical protein E5676_scaffold84664G00860 [Cucumis melo var. makuwa]
MGKIQEKEKRLLLTFFASKSRKTPSEELVEEFERKLDNLSPLKDEVVKSSKKKKKVTIKKSVLKEQFIKRREEKEKKKGPLSEVTLEEEEDLKGEKNEPFCGNTISKYFKIENELFPF